MEVKAELHRLTYKLRVPNVSRLIWEPVILQLRIDNLPELILEPNATEDIYTQTEADVYSNRRKSESIFYEYHFIQKFEYAIARRITDVILCRYVEPSKKTKFDTSDKFATTNIATHKYFCKDTPTIYSEVSADKSEIVSASTNTTWGGLLGYTTSPWECPIAHPSRWCRHLIFPEILRIVHQYVAQKIIPRSLGLCELGTEPYQRLVMGCILPHIESVKSDFRYLLFPIIHKISPWQCTTNIQYTTTKEIYIPRRSHLNYIPINNQLELQFAQLLDQHPKVHSYAKNEGQLLRISYPNQLETGIFEPTFLVRMKDTSTTIIWDIKEQENEQNISMYNEANTWCQALNNWGMAGQWKFFVSYNLNSIVSQLGQI